jgi:ethanolamine transporter EutH
MMAGSALEQAAINALASLGNWVREHDRFVVIGLLFSMFPLPPACFAGLLIAILNTWLLNTGALPQREAKAVRWSLLLGMLNSALVAYGMVWISTHANGMDKLVNLPFMPDIVNALLNHLADYFRWLLQLSPAGNAKTQTV